MRGINVGGAAALPMVRLRALTEELGWTEVRSYIQSGNLVFRAPGSSRTLERALESAITAQTGLTAPVLVRSATDWMGLVRENPFPNASEDTPNLVMAALSRDHPGKKILARLTERASGGEQVAWTRRAVWIHYDRGVAHSKLAPGQLDRLLGTVVTTRNWRTVLKVAELLRA